MAVVQFDQDRQISGKVRPYSCLRYLALIEDSLSRESLVSFTNTCFGPLLKLKQMQLYCQLYLKLVSCLDPTRSMNKLTFHINNRDMVFGPVDFALVTGLRFGPNSQTPTSSRIHAEYFSDLGNNITIADIEVAFTRCDQAKFEDKLKLALLLVLYGLILGRVDTAKVDMDYFHIVDDLDDFNKYPWGRVGYEFLINDIHDKGAKFFKDVSVKKDVFYNANGFPLALQFWAFEAMPSVASLCGRPINPLPEKQNLPRMLWWKCETPRLTMKNLNKGFAAVKFTVPPRLEAHAFEADKEAYLSARQWEVAQSSMEQPPRGSTEAGVPIAVQRFVDEKFDAVMVKVNRIEALLMAVFSHNGWPLPEEGRSDQKGVGTSSRDFHVGGASNAGGEKSIERSPIQSPDVELKGSTEYFHHDGVAKMKSGEKECPHESWENEGAEDTEDNVQVMHDDDGFKFNENETSDKGSPHAACVETNEVDYQSPDNDVDTKDDSVGVELMEGENQPPRHVVDVVKDDDSGDGKVQERINDGNGKRIRSLSVFKSDPYTDPSHHIGRRTKRSRGSMYDPFSTHLSTETEEATKWILAHKTGERRGTRMNNKKNKEDGSSELTGPHLRALPVQYFTSADATWFDRIRSPTKDLDGSHVDVLMHLVMVKAKRNPEMFVPKWSCIDQSIFDLLHLTYPKWAEERGKGKWDWSTESRTLCKYILGELPYDGIPLPWDQERHVYGIGNVNNNHWVLYDLDFVNHKIVVYDTLNEHSKWSEDESGKFNRLAEMMPSLLAIKRDGSSTDSVQWSIDAFDFKGIRQHNNHDCGIYCVKMFECLVVGRPVTDVNLSNGTNYRLDIVTDLYHYNTL